MGSLLPEDLVAVELSPQVFFLILGPDDELSTDVEHAGGSDSVYSVVVLPRANK